MRFTYDLARSERNIAERGLVFDLAEDFDWSTALIAEDTRQDFSARETGSGTESGASQGPTSPTRPATTSTGFPRTFPATRRMSCSRSSI